MKKIQFICITIKGTKKEYQSVITLVEGFLTEVDMEIKDFLQIIEEEQEKAN